MNIWDILILAAVAAALFLAFRTAVGNRKNCCGGCSGCSMDAVKRERPSSSCRSAHKEETL